MLSRSLFLLILLVGVLSVRGAGRIPKKAAVYLARVESLLHVGAAKRALQSLRKDVPRGVPQLQRATLLARTYLALERPDKAETAIRGALKKNSEDPALYVLAGKIYSLQEDPQREIAALSRATELNPDLGEAHFLLALAYDKVSNSPKMLEHAQKAIRIDPDFKRKLKPRVKDSNLSREIGKIVTKVLEDSRYERLTDEQIDEYAQEIGEILGEDDFAHRNGMRRPPRKRLGGEKISEVLTSIRKRQAAEAALRSGSRPTIQVLPAKKRPPSRSEGLGPKQEVQPESPEPSMDPPSEESDEKQKPTGSWLLGPTAR
jgi:tetratricopeptide (TPR) repeat protein